MAHYLTQILLTPEVIYKERITDTYSLHRVVYDQFDRDLENNTGSRAFPLWDVVYSQKQRKLIIMSASAPREATDFLKNYRSTIEFPENILKQNYYNFALTVNPTKKKDERVIPIKDRESIREWFLKVSAKNGFEVDSQYLEIEKIYADIFVKSNHKVTINKARIKGSLKVTNQELFSKAVFNGIGREKSFGCGLLQIVPKINAE